MHGQNINLPVCVCVCVCVCVGVCAFVNSTLCGKSYVGDGHCGECLSYGENFVSPQGITVYLHELSHFKSFERYLFFPHNVPVCDFALLSP